jgi:erythronate-4-phosphate dehydrogenase
MIRIIADSKIPFLRGALEKHAGISYLPAKDIGPARVRNADALIIRTRTRCNEQLLAGSAVRYIATATIGFDHIDHEYCRENGISWSNASGCNSGSVMQYIASALARIVTLERKKFGDLTLGIVGAGNVGRKVEKLARSLGMKVILNDPPRERVEGGGGFVHLDTLLEGSDIVTMHVPLNRKGKDNTYHLCGNDFFTKMKKGGWFINTSRGEVMETASLIRSLKGRLAGAVIDVWENEPDIDRELLALVTIGTPHIAGYSLDGKANGTAQSVRAVSKYFGLATGNWYPAIPPPENGLVIIEKDYGCLDELLCRLFLHCYDIEADSSGLKSRPGFFESFRDDYPPRREFGAYRLYFENSAETCIMKMQDIGFMHSDIT